MDLFTLAIPMLLCAAAFGALRFAKRVAFAGYCFVDNCYFIVNQQNTPPPFSLLHKAEPQRFSPNNLQLQSHAAIRRSGFFVLNFMFNLILF